MSRLAPPRPPILVTIEDDGLGRLHFRLWQVLMTGITVLVTTWFVTFGAIPAIIALMVAKHVLVAILVRGFDEPGGAQETASRQQDIESAARETSPFPF
jgi:hypothetical protein